MLLSFASDTARPNAPGDLHRWCADIQVVPVDPFAANRTSTLRTFLSLRPPLSRPISAMDELVAEAFRSRCFDAVIASSDMMVSYALQAPNNTVKILEEHNSLTRWMQERYESALGSVYRLRCWVSWQKRRLYESHIYRDFDLITMVSHQDCTATQTIIGQTHPPVRVVPNGVDCGERRPSEVPPVAGRLIYSGALTYSANFDAVSYFLDNIFPRVKQQCADAHLVVTGSVAGVDTTRFESNESVTLTGFVEDVNREITQAMVCVVPLLAGGGTRLKILEAMALGVPIVSTSKGAEGLDVVDGEHLLLADNPTAFARCILELLGNRELGRQLAVNARRLVEERYDWHAIGVQFSDLLESVVESRSESPA